MNESCKRSAPALPEPQAHVLLVDDDERIRDLLRRFLARHGYLVTAARDAAQARRLMGGLDFDLVVLDVMMPGEDGVTFCRALRAGSGVPVLLLTARGAPSDRIAGLEAGADDYLPKPFEPQELLLRLRAILRRAPVAEAPRVLHMGPVRYDLERGELWNGAEPVRLTATETLLMRIFAGAPGQPVSRADLIDRLGRGGDEGATQERAVDVQITRLRRKIESDPRRPRYLQTVRGEGYMLAPD